MIYTKINTNIWIQNKIFLNSFKYCDSLDFVWSIMLSNHWALTIYSIIQYMRHIAKWQYAIIIDRIILNILSIEYYVRTL